MISATTQARLMRLSLWRPPVGVRRAFVIWDDGTIEVHLEGRTFAESAVLCPDCSPVGFIRRLSLLARRLLDAECRVERELAAAGSRFRAGLRRAVRPGDVA